MPKAPRILRPHRPRVEQPRRPRPRAVRRDVPRRRRDRGAARERGGETRRAHHRRGHTVCIVSAATRYQIAPLARETNALIDANRDIVTRDRTQQKFLLGWINRTLAGVAA